jgi:nicotinamidase-related amidase
MSGADTPRGQSTCDAADSILIIVDVQQRLGDAMPAKVLNRVLFNTQLLAKTAGLLDVPVLKTEQYPRGLGPTHPAVTEALPEATRAYEKLTFSCCRADGFLDELRSLGRRQTILVGMEAHVCVLQSAFDLHGEGFVPLVVEDAVCSRRLENYQNALDRLRQSQVPIVSAESVVFEWLGAADHQHFKAVQKLLR